MPGRDFRYTFGESMGRTDMTARMGLIALVILGFANSASAFEISSPSVSNGKWDGKYIADKAAGCDGKNISIALKWRHPPAGTKSFAVTVFDPDARHRSLRRRDC